MLLPNLATRTSMLLPNLTSLSSLTTRLDSTRNMPPPNTCITATTAATAVPSSPSRPPDTSLPRLRSLLSRLRPVSFLRLRPPKLSLVPRMPSWLLTRNANRPQVQALQNCTPRCEEKQAHAQVYQTPPPHHQEIQPLENGHPPLQSDEEIYQKSRQTHRPQTHQSCQKTYQHA